MDQQAALLKEAYEKARAANATLLYFQDATQNETKMENIKRFKSYIVDAVFSGQELKKIIMAFPFAVPRLKDGVRDMIVYFKPEGGNYKVNEKSHYGKYVMKVIIAALERQPHHTIDFGSTLDVKDWYKVLVNEHLLLKIIYQKQCKRRETITDKVRREASKLIHDMSRDDPDQLDCAATMFANITMFASDRPAMCNFKLIQFMFAHGFHVLADKFDYMEDPAKRKKKKNINEDRLKYETKKTLEAQSIFKVMQPAMIALFIINAQRAFIKIIADVNELPPEMKNNNFPIMLNDEDFSMMLDSVPANPVDDGGVAVARMDEKILKGLCAKGYPNDVMGYHRELTSRIRDYKESLAKNVIDVIDYVFSFETLRVKCSSSAAECKNLDDDCDDGDDSVSMAEPEPEDEIVAV
jgi:hypothetical protein